MTPRPHVLTMLAASGVSAAAPLLLLVVAAHQLPAGGAAAVALALAIAGYLAQIVGAAEVESRLPVAVDLIRLPRWIGLLGMAPLAALAAAWADPVVAYGLLAITVVPLEVSRSVSVVCHRVRAEALASFSLAAGLLLGLLGRSAPLTVAAVSAGMVVALVVRWRDQRRGSVAPRRAGWRWILLETASTGVTQPALSFLVAGLMGAQATVALRSVTGVVNVMSPALAFVRLRLLSGRDMRHAVFAAACCAGAAAAIWVAQALGLLGALIGPAWNDVGLLAVTLALLWKLATVGTVLPFAELRRRGRFALASRVRLASCGIYLALGVGACLVLGTVTAVFLAYLVAEVTAWLTYVLALRRDRELVS